MAGVSFYQQFEEIEAVTLDRFLFILTAPATTITDIDDNGARLILEPTKAWIKVNGVQLLETADYTIAADGLTVTFVTTWPIGTEIIAETLTEAL